MLQHLESKHVFKVQTAEEMAGRIRAAGTEMGAIARDLVMMIDSTPGFAQQVIAAGVPEDVLSGFERLGRGQLNPDLLFAVRPGLKRLELQSCSTQDDVLAEGLEVLDYDESTTRRIPAKDLTDQQARQVFAGDHVRSLAEQRTWIREKKRKAPALVESAVPWHCYKDCVHVRVAGKYDRKTVLEWLNQMQ